MSQYHVETAGGLVMYGYDRPCVEYFAMIDRLPTAEEVVELEVPADQKMLVCLCGSMSPRGGTMSDLRDVLEEVGEHARGEMVEGEVVGAAGGAGGGREV